MIVQTPPCVVCRQTGQVEVDPVAYERWRNGEDYIQNLFPELNSDQREMLISGTHPECWSKLFPAE